MTGNGVRMSRLRVMARKALGTLQHPAIDDQKHCMQSSDCVPENNRAVLYLFSCKLIINRCTWNLVKMLTMSWFFLWMMCF